MTNLRNFTTLPVQHLTTSGKSTDSVPQTQQFLDLITSKLNNTRIIDCKKSPSKKKWSSWFDSSQRRKIQLPDRSKENGISSPTPEGNGHKPDPKPKAPGTLQSKTLTQLIFGNKTETRPSLQPAPVVSEENLVSGDLRLWPSNEREWKFPDDVPKLTPWWQGKSCQSVGCEICVVPSWRRGDLQSETCQIN